MVTEHYNRKRQQRKDTLTFLAGMGAIIGASALGAYAAHQTGLLDSLGRTFSLNPTHATIHDLSNGYVQVGLNSNVALDHVSTAALTNGHHVTTQVYDVDGYGKITGNEFTINDTTPGSNKYFDVILEQNTPVANFQFLPGHSYDLQGSQFTEIVGHTPSGADITVELLDISKITDDGVSNSFTNSFTSLMGGLVGAVNGFPFSPKLPGVLV